MLWSIFFSVKIQVGRMHCVQGEMVKIRSSSVGVTIRTDATAEEVLTAAVEKQLACNRTLPKTDYKLLYPDGSPVAFIPGTEESFSVLKYKSFLGKPYQRVVLYVCTEDEFHSGIYSYVLLVTFLYEIL